MTEHPCWPETVDEALARVAEMLRARADRYEQAPWYYASRHEMAGTLRSVADEISGFRAATGATRPTDHVYKPCLWAGLRLSVR